ncbi:MAG: glycoside hydrolase family 2 TIM barrel-domain containing protein [Ignavibacteria bacterium]
MRYKNCVSLVIACSVVSGLLFGQIRINSLPHYDLISQDSLFFNNSHLRTVISLDGAWNVYIHGVRDEISLTSIPCNFKGEEDLTFEKELKLTQRQIMNNKFQLVFLGLNYSAEIILNNLVIYKHPGGDFPFRVSLPNNLLKTGQKNVLAVKVFYKLQSDATVPVSQRFLFPESQGGIFRDVYIQTMPLTHISNLEYSYKITGGRHINIVIQPKVENHTANENDSLQDNTFSIKTRLISPNGEDILGSAPAGFKLPAKRENTITLSYNLSNITLWTPQIPYTYSLMVQLFRGDQLIDEIRRPVSFFSLEATRENLMLNGIPYLLNGTTYYSSYADDGNMSSFEKMRDDIKIIKSMGFNAVRFSKASPHPYLLRLCEQNGLLAFIELPINSIPQEIISNNVFINIVSNYLQQFILYYKEYSAVAAIGLGGSYIPNSADNISFLSMLAEVSKSRINKLTYASFIGFSVSEISKLDMYGIEFLNKPVEAYVSKYETLENSLGKGRVFISEATYATFLGSTNGYSNPFSFEAQAKYFSDLIDYTHKKQISGYFINSVFDYRGDYPSFVAGFSPVGLYSIGVLGEDRQQERLSQKVIFSKLHDNEDLTIPIGSKKDDSPLVFMIYGLSLALMTGVLVNSRKKFREDATRALLRPYNFFADIRDMRILSGLHTTILMIILSLCSALLQVNLLYYLRANVLLEKLVLAFGSPVITKCFAYLAWNPADALIWVTAASVLFFIVASIIIKISSFFIRNKVFFSSIYFMVVWSFLPLLLLLPFGLVLYKILNASYITIYLFIALSVFTLWIYYRLMKGIHVIFDVNSAQVYFYSLTFIIVILGGVLIYLQLSESTIYYMINAFYQYRLM